MSITLKALIQESSKSFQLHQIAGKRGLNNLVSWVHIIEDESIAPFLLGGELIFTTGIGHAKDNWLIPFCESLLKAGCSGLVLNIGPYIPSVPPEIIEFCDNASLPLFTTPWESRLVQITQEFGYRIMTNENVEINISNTFKQLIFEPSYYDYCISSLLQHGYSSSDKYSVAVLLLCNRHTPTNDMPDPKTILATEFMLKRYCPDNSFAYFGLPGQIVIILTQKAASFLTQLPTRLAHIPSGDSGSKLYAGVGQIDHPLSDLADNYQLALKVAHLAKTLDSFYLSYRDLGVYKLLMLHGQETVVSDFYQDTLHRLLEYDRSNGTDYVDFLEQYINADFSIHALAESSFLHRNTVYYKLGKIESILGQDLNNWKFRLSLLLCQYIKNLL